MIRRMSHIFLQLSILLLEFSIYKLKIISPVKYGKWLARRIERMGGIYLKIGQLLSVRPDIISFTVADQLYPLLQQLKPVPFKHIKKVIEDQEGFPFNKKILEIETTPLATASIAQVHKVVLENGGHAVLKVLKSGIRNHVGTDLKIFNFFMKVGAHLPGIKQMPVKELASEIDILIRQQLDLTEEAKNQLEFKKNFRENPFLLIPELYDELIYPDFIGMQYVLLPSEIDFESWPAEKRTEVAKRALQILYQMMFRDGLTHCDLHPGNFFITQAGTFILLDFGMVARMRDELRIDFIKFFFYMSTNNGKGCADIIKKTALHRSKRFNQEELYKEVSMFISEFSSLDAEKFSVLAFTQRLIEVERKCGIKGSTYFINNILAIAFFESRLKRIDPGIDFQEEAAQYIMKNVPSLEEVFEGM